MVWTALAQLTPLGSSAPIAHARGAYCNLYGVAADAEDFRNRVMLAVAQLDMAVVDLADLGPVGGRQRTQDAHVRQCVREAEGAPAEIYFDTFFTYDDTDD